MRAILSVLLCLGFLSAAKAEIIDLSTRTCRQFQTSDPDEIKIILAWLDAYYKDEDDPPVIDTDKLIANAKKLGEYCSANPTIGLITAADNFLTNECSVRSRRRIYGAQRARLHHPREWLRCS